MEITRRTEREHKRGPAEWFTGEVDILEIVPPGALLVTFQPGARTAWHTHPNGQTLHVVSGTARIGRHPGGTDELGAGDCVSFAPGELHWHGAAPGGAMSHVAIAQPGADGQPTHWQAHVTDAEYGS